MSKALYQRQIPLFVISFLVALFMVESVIAYQPLTDLKNSATAWVTIVANVATLYGITTLLILHVRRLTKAEQQLRQRFPSIVTLATMALFIAVSLIYGGYQSELFQFLYLEALSIVGLNMIALKYSGHFFATYRSFTRHMSWEAVLFFVSWFISVARNVSLLIYLFPWLAPIADWIYLVPNVAALRAATLAAAVGTVMVGLRALIMRERGIIETEVE